VLVDEAEIKAQGRRNAQPSPLLLQLSAGYNRLLNIQGDLYAQGFEKIRLWKPLN
jgi:hypothetical protein